MPSPKKLIALAKLRERRAQRRARAADDRAEATVSLCRTVQEGRARRAGRWCLMPLKRPKGRRGRVDSLQVRAISKNQRVAANISLDLAYNPERLGTAVRTSGLSAGTVRRHRQAVAAAYLREQDELLAELANKLVHTNAPFRVVSVSECFDETTEHLHLLLPAQEQIAQTTSAWHVLVSVASVFVSTVGEERLDLVRPPVALLRTDAGSLHAGLDCVAGVRPISAATAELWAAFARGCDATGSPGVCFHHTDRDAATSCSKVMAHRQNMLPQHVLASDWKCSLHQVHLIEIGALSERKGLLAFLYSSALLLRMGGYFVRLAHAVPVYVHSALRIIEGGPPPNSRELTDALLQHMKARLLPEKFDDTSTSTDADAKERRRGGMAFAAWQQLFNILNGDLTSDHLTHYCEGPTCCANRATTERRAIHAIQKVFFKTLPIVPCASRWMRLSPSVDFHLAGTLVHNMFGKLFSIAFSDLPLPGGRGGANAALGCEDEIARAGLEQLQMDVAWHAVAGARLKRTLQVQASQGQAARLAIAAMVLAPLNQVAAFFLRAAAASSREAPNPPWLCDLLSPKHSCVTWALRHYTSILRGQAPCLLFLLSPEGFRLEDVPEWVAAHQGDAVALQRSLLAAAAGLHRRVQSVVESWPWAIAALADKRRPVEERRECAERFLKYPLCCLDAMWSRRLRAKGLTVAELVGDGVDSPWPTAIGQWAHTVRLSSASVEVRHARNRQSSAKGLSWSLFAANFCNREARCLAAEADERARRVPNTTVVAAVTAAATPQARSPTARPIRTLAAIVNGARRRHTILDLVRHGVVNEARLAGHSANPASRAVWEEARRILSNLSAPEKADLQQLANMSGIVARNNRRRSGEVELQILDGTGSNSSPEPDPSASSGPSPTVELAGQLPQPTVCELNMRLRETSCSLVAACPDSSGRPKTQSGQAGPQPASQLVEAKHPLAEVRFKRHVEEMGGVKVAADGFANRCNEVAFPLRDFPAQVHTPSVCGSLCSAHGNEKWRLSMHSRLLSTLLHAAATVPREETLPFLACIIKSADGRTNQVEYGLVAWKGRSDLSIAKCCCCRGSKGGSKREVTPGSRLRLCASSEEGHAFLTGSDWCGRLVRRCELGGCVAVRKVTYKLETLDTFLVTEPSGATAEPVKVKAQDVAETADKGPIDSDSDCNLSLAKRRRSSACTAGSAVAATATAQDMSEDEHDDAFVRDALLQLNIGIGDCAPDLAEASTPGEGLGAPPVVLESSTDPPTAAASSSNSARPVVLESSTDPPTAAASSSNSARPIPRTSDKLKELLPFGGENPDIRLVQDEGNHRWSAYYDYTSDVQVPTRLSKRTHSRCWGKSTRESRHSALGHCLDWLWEKHAALGKGDIPDDLAGIIRNRTGWGLREQAQSKSAVTTTKQKQAKEQH